jgi:V/A-type H+-transporting ATPase subunit G/H
LEHEKTATVSTSHSAVESIIGALAQLETDIDGMNARVDEMKRRLMAHSNEQIEKLRQQIISMANEEAKKIVDSAKAEAEAESAAVMKDAEKNLASIKKNIDASFDKAVESIVKTVLGQEAPKTEPKPVKPKKYTSEGKPAQ